MDQDENGIAERQEQLVQQRMSAMLTTLFFSQKRAIIHQTTQLKHLGGDAENAGLENAGQ